jgi:hypothetical protein
MDPPNTDVPATPSVGSVMEHKTWPCRTFFTRSRSWKSTVPSARSLGFRSFDVSKGVHSAVVPLTGGEPCAIKTFCRRRFFRQRASAVHHAKATFFLARAAFIGPEKAPSPPFSGGAHVMMRAQLVMGYRNCITASRRERRRGFDGRGLRSHSHKSLLTSPFFFVTRVCFHYISKVV